VLTAREMTSDRNVQQENFSSTSMACSLWIYGEVG
jgi:hypothetical protein